MRIYQEGLSNSQLHAPETMMGEDRRGQQNQQQLNRNTIKRIKKMLVIQDDQYESLRVKFLGQQAYQQAQNGGRLPRKSAWELDDIVARHVENIIIKSE